MSRPSAAAGSQSKGFMSLFRGPDGTNYAFVFMLVCSLFLLWGFCSGLLDNLNKHFQNSLNISKFQSGFVQNAFYMGYFLMALPAGLLARRLGYKSGVIIGLALAAAGAFWFIPATKSDSWTGVTSWMAARFDMEVVHSPEAKAKLMATRAAMNRAAQARPDLKKGQTRSVEADNKSKTDASAALAKAQVELEAAALLLPQSKNVGTARIALAEAIKAVPTDKFGEKLSDAVTAVVATDKASQVTAFLAFLLGLFVIALGLACLETIANPYTTVLGPPESGPTRINMAQTCNGVGWISGMLIGSLVILSSTQEVNISNEQLSIPYLGIGIAVAILLICFIFANIPDLHATEEFKSEAEGKATKPIAKRAHFTMGVLSQFLYVAAQTGIFSFFINYAVANIQELSDQAGGKLQTVAFALFTLGRFTGSAVVGFTKPHKALAVYAVINTLLMVITMVGGGLTGVICLMASFFFMSIMFPTIFALSIRGLGEHTKLGASVLVMSIVGGAIMTPLMGWIADKGGMRIGFIIPMICFAIIAAYGTLWQKLESKDAGEKV